MLNPNYLAKAVSGGAPFGGPIHCVTSEPQMRSRSQEFNG